uniref:Uncharacterized protein n=1 Tax=Kwoniella bestiolae CBS 10118 TaxID=1296100 RepID=A0A1B9FYK7_9TREE|nr:hypothetical protein I302_06842 [Kwoniella bestiolae CBS 10118]OCF23857.1 hypothetical protein I302_06842 [Kwoniella bestiolae CBS 10118]
MAAKTQSCWKGMSKNGLNNMDGDGYSAVGPEIPREFTFFDNHYQIKSHYDAAEVTLRGKGFQ